MFVRVVPDPTSSSGLQLLRLMTIIGMKYNNYPTPAVKAAGVFIARAVFQALLNKKIADFLVCDFCFIIFYAFVEFFFLLYSSTTSPTSIIAAKTMRYQIISIPCLLMQAVMITPMPAIEAMGSRKRFTG